MSLKVDTLVRILLRATAFIFARGGSKGLPGKNLLQLSGKPLIAWAIEHALSVKRIDRVIVSTDSEEIAKVAKEFGAEVPFIRPAELATDESPEWLAWRHALLYLKEATGKMPTVMVSIPATSPLRSTLDIENCLDKFENGSADIVITVKEADRSPYFNMVRDNLDGSVSLLNNLDSGFTRRQDVPTAYDVLTVCYVARSAFILENESLFDGRVEAVLVPNERALDIDTPYDFQIAKAIILSREEE
jgi:N-acylneuraminate cytidylyltransferase